MPEANDFRIAVILALITMVLSITIVYYHKKLKKKDDDQISHDHFLIQILCHDIANPLNNIQLANYLIEEQSETLALSDKQKADLLYLINQIEKGSVIIDSIIKNVRKIESLENGKMKLTLTRLNIENEITKSREAFSETLKNKDIQLNFNSNLSPQSFFMGDPNGFGPNILNNIISNAIKFSHKGSSIDITATEEENEIHLEIRDHGIGMSKDMLNQLFLEGEQTTRQGTQGEKGTGFGMPLVKTCMNYHDAKISVESNVIDLFPKEHGTTFHLYLKKAI